MPRRLVLHSVNSSESFLLVVRITSTSEQVSHQLRDCCNFYLLWQKFPHYAPIMLHYASIMLYAFPSLLCQKLCWHNRRKPNARLLNLIFNCRIKDSNNYLDHIYLKELAISSYYYIEDSIMYYSLYYL